MRKFEVGVISDTHDLLRPEALKALDDADLIVHAGDVCRAEILDELRRIAPVHAVRGNNDRGEWAKNLPVFEIVEVGKVLIYIIHDLKQMDLNSSNERINVVISGHSHRPYVEKRGRILYINPGSAGRRRFKLPVTLARLTVIGEVVEAEIIKLIE